MSIQRCMDGGYKWQVVVRQEVINALCVQWKMNFDEVLACEIDLFVI